jgi:hypothetical protein
MGFLLIIAFVVGVPALLLSVHRWAPPELVRGEWPETWPTISPRRIWQIGGAIALAVFLCAFANAGPHEEGFFLLLAVLIMVALFLWTWQREFLFLMGLRDDAFPGRFDKPIWAVFLITMAPVSLWFFRSYRLAHWPEPKQVRGQTVSDLF